MTDPDSSEQSHQKEQTAPDPDDPRKASDPRDLSRPTRKFILKNTVREFLDDECTDIAAGLTYYATLSLFPGLLALISILGLVGQAETTTSTVLGMLDDLGVGSTMVDTIEPVIGQLTQNESAGFALVAGLVLAIWSASGYVNSFGRAMKRVYEIDEGRPIWKLRPMMLLVTVGLLILAVATALALVVSGPVAQVVGGAIGLSDVAVTVWSIAKWPVLLGIVIVMVAILYHYTPNVRHRLEMGRYILAEDYMRALRGRAVLTAEVDAALADCDALLLPTLPIPAHKIGVTSVRIGATDENIRNLTLRLTQLFNVTGHPAIALPCGSTPEGLPISAQLVGRRAQTDRLLSVARALEPHLGPGASR